MTQNQNRPRWVESLENYSKALDSLNKVVELSQQKTLSEFERDSLIKRRKRRYLGRYFAHPMMQNRRAKRDDYKPSAVRVTQRYVP
ncbi:hypothetical protein Psal006b_03406 (plasmid) [Piscirickettsia salmonis]|uniref:Nucleotidyltransferase substrate-binding, HI0074 family protein n=2 Tax=Piscirickettsia salmonis TaxID=1238 RepID=A0AAC8ZQ72_PISSA|nr:hypothetical protein [Piscirickettsia salmonis]AKP74981.1 hypothetical protein PSLF89_1p216 [Piscirickettsia salmonis LF-89 = ATCC VR-1361]ALB24570.1 nucleotidyltransferase substrate-binding, HI0074 family protein [Piscirickettsia salmonis]ALY04455.1 hypothetical protein AWE47_16195 [Piscirickettsia salmonis]AMA43972.1 hypothetical protein AWJ11_16460 [Piscirickettsia salmonis]AOS37027.1 hypothetical protein AVM72_16810 [Piscirickettsia salmonis]